MHTRSVLLVSALLVVVPGLAVAAVTGSPDVSAQFADDHVAPGEQTSLDVVLLNEGDLESSSTRDPSLNSQVTTARGLTVAVNSGSAPISVVTGQQAVGTLPEGASNPIPFEVVVDADADAGTYDVPVVVRYSYTSYISETDGTRNRESTTERLRVPIRVDDSARVDVVDVNSSARAGGSDPVAVTVENGGSITANDVQLTLSSSSGDVRFGEAGSARRYIETWEPGEQRTLRYDVTATGDAEPGEYGFTMTGRYEEPDGRQRVTDNVSVPVTLASEQRFELTSVSSNLAVGDDGEITGELTNPTNSTVENVVLQWATEQNNVAATESEYAVGELGANESAAFAFDVEIGESARSGPRQFTFRAQYEDDDGDTLASDDLVIQRPVDPETDQFDVAIDRGEVRAGGSTSIDVTLTNAGDERVSDVSGKLFAESPMSTTDSEVYVQSLEPGESANVTFGIAAGGGALEKTYPLSLDFRYDEPDGDTVNSDTYRVPVSVTTGDGGGLPVGVIGVVALVAILGVGAAVRYT